MEAKSSHACVQTSLRSKVHHHPSPLFFLNAFWNLLARQCCSLAEYGYSKPQSNLTALPSGILLVHTIYLVVSHHDAVGSICSFFQGNWGKLTLLLFAFSLPTVLSFALPEGLASNMPCLIQQDNRYPTWFFYQTRTHRRGVNHDPALNMRPMLQNTNL